MMTTMAKWGRATGAVLLAACGVPVGDAPDLGSSAGGGVTAPGDGSGDDGGADGNEDDDGAPGGDGDAADEESGGESTGGGEGDDGASTGAPDGAGSTGGEDDGSTDGGSTGGVVSDGDLDDDGIPDDEDPFPNDPDWPGTVAAGVVYAQTADALFTMDVDDYAIAQVGPFTFPAGPAGLVTDVAIDQWGVLYGITFDQLVVCQPDTAACQTLANLPSQANGATFIPPGTLDPLDDTLIGIAITGDWRQLELQGGMVAQMVLGGYGGGYTSSGDAFSIFGVGTWASVDAPGQADDVIVEIDPATGAVQAELATLTGYTSIYGLAGWDGSVFAFDASGAVLRVDPGTGSVTLLAQTPYAWWGAAVSTVLPT